MTPSRSDRRPCRVIGCEGEMLDGRLMCGKCWNRVPQELQRRVRQSQGRERIDTYREALVFVAAKLVEGAGSEARLFHVETKLGGQDHA